VRVEAGNAYPGISDIKIFFHSDLDELSLKKLVEKTGADGFFKKSSDREGLLRMVQMAVSP